jgi:flagellar motor switch protein FliG
MDLNTSKQNGVFINGKEQIVEMLRAMPGQDRQRLLNNMRLKNPTLTTELEKLSLSIDHLESFSEHQLLVITRQVNPAIMGLALKGMKTETQRFVLSKVSREYAEKAYDVMISPITDEVTKVKRAKSKIKEVMMKFKSYQS